MLALVNIVKNFWVHKMWRISRLAEWLLPSQEGVCSMRSVGQSVSSDQMDGYLVATAVCHWVNFLNQFYWFDSGKNCEIDINECESSPCQYGGTCLQRSNQSLYQQDGSQPALFPEKFSYLSASG
jgi:hypothetical protein